MTTIPEAESQPPIYRILSLDGGGAKGFYTLGLLNEIEGITQKPLSESFDLIFGTSTGAIIASLLALGCRVSEIIQLYRDHVPALMGERDKTSKTAALKKLTTTIYGDKDFSAFKTGIGIVTTNWNTDEPKVFKASKDQAHGRTGTFKPGFGFTIAEAVVASCSAYPFFDLQTLKTPSGEIFKLADGGFCANNPSLYALVDVLGPLKLSPENIRLVSLGVGIYPERSYPLLSYMRFCRLLPTVRFLQKTLEINTNSMELLQKLLFKNVPTVRINEKFPQPHMATDLLECDTSKLELLYECGGKSFAEHEEKLRTFLL